MFEPASKPRVFALAPGVDFPRALVSGLATRLDGQPPEAMARVEILVNSGRMLRRVREVFDAGPPRLLPRIRLITDLGADPDDPGSGPPASPLRRRLELAQLVARLLEKDPTLAPRAATYDLADSLAALFEEMHGEGVDPARVADLDVTDLSGHWARALQFLTIAERFFEKGHEAPDAAQRQRQAVEGLARRWATTPPAHPIIVAGSTGSRGTTELLMDAVARLPQGALVLPGFDFDQPDEVWNALAETDAHNLAAEDHPQYRYARLMTRLGLVRGDIASWSADPAPVPARNSLLSLALRPAPVTDQWLRDGPRLTQLDAATANMTLVEAATPREEALAIALGMRGAVEDGRRVALITPDRNLTRQVTAALDRWGIRPDDSAGMPLQLSPPGRFLRQVAALGTEIVTAAHLLALLKHPLTATGGAARGQHLLWTRELELHLRRHGPPFPTAEALAAWAGKSGKDDGRGGWAQWVGATILPPQVPGNRTLADHLAAHLDRAEAIAAGPGAAGSGELWQEEPGRKALATVTALRDEAGHGGAMSATDYANLFRAVLVAETVRDTETSHPGVLIWGTLEARVQGADLVILGGLNDGIWPPAPGPDPWLNRAMRQQAGLLLPERAIGLSAHDFQQAAAVGEVWLTRSKRSDDAETVPSRWMNRLGNLLAGLSGDGQEAWAGMAARGALWCARARELDRPKVPVPPAPRPAPRPPAEARPKELSVTRIKTLVRDPYAIYAEKILRLKPLDPLVPEPGAPQRGIVIHEILERFVAGEARGLHPTEKARLMAIADRVLEDGVPWPTARQIWRARLERVAEIFLADEVLRQKRGSLIGVELRGRLALTRSAFVLTAKADRMDRADDGSVLIYDYKTGAPPSERVQREYDLQLLLEGAMVEAGGFPDVGPAPVLAAEYIGLGSTPKVVPAPLAEPGLAVIWKRFEGWIADYSGAALGYTARRALQKSTDTSPYDHLSRYGEWDTTMAPTPQDVP